MRKRCFLVLSKDKKVYWENGLNHIAVIEKYNLNKAMESRRYLCRVRVDYVDDEWKIVFHPPYAPDWYSPAHEKVCWIAFQKWLEVEKENEQKRRNNNNGRMGE